VAAVVITTGETSSGRKDATAEEMIEDEMLEGTIEETTEDEMIEGTIEETTEDEMIEGTIEDEMIDATSVIAIDINVYSNIFIHNEIHRIRQHAIRTRTNGQTDTDTSSLCVSQKPTKGMERGTFNSSMYIEKESPALPSSIPFRLPFYSTNNMVHKPAPTKQKEKKIQRTSNRIHNSKREYP